MEIRASREPCPTCTAPEIYPEVLPVIETFLELLPAWRTTGMDRIAEGFDRGEVRALLDLRGVADQPALWAALAPLESELARIRAESSDG